MFEKNKQTKNAVSRVFCVDFCYFCRMLEGISKQSAFAATRGSPSAMLKKGGGCVFLSVCSK